MSQSKLVRFIFDNWPVKPIITFSKHSVCPGFEGLPLYDVGDFFIKRLNEGELQTRARAIAFSFFGILPDDHFHLYLIPYIPIQSFPDKLLLLISDLPSFEYLRSRERNDRRHPLTPARRTFIFWFFLCPVCISRWSYGTYDMVQ